ncbi:MAG TPA: heme-binding protein [Ktedonobacteraceae bacterium]|nr:heme-binding protein [Ktedonobacteraceae bacterium]
MSISIDIARRVMNACKQRAEELRSPVSIAIVDAGGHLVLFERMMAPYGWATGNISIAKASTAVMFNQSTDAVAQWGSGIPGFASSMATMSQGKFIMAAGGWPIRMGGATIGGIGISGGNAPGRDDDIARVGLAAIEPSPSAQHSSYRPQQPSMQPAPAYPSMPSHAPLPQPSEPGSAAPLQASSSVYLGNEHESSPDDGQLPLDDYQESNGGQS